MNTKKKKLKKDHSLLIGRKIGSMECIETIEFGDAVLLIGDKNEQSVFIKSSIETNPLEYHINDQIITRVEYNRAQTLFILHTSQSTYFRNKENQAIPDSENWTDYYLEPFTDTFYRKDNRNYWYDIQGNQLSTPYFINNDILCSLVNKTSKKSLFYKDQKLFTNTNQTLVQVGKVVFNSNLDRITYFGEKITGLGSTRVTFDEKKSVQEVRLGLDKSAFIYEDSFLPFTIFGDEIIEHEGSKHIGNYHFELFKSPKKSYVLCDSFDRILHYEDFPLRVDFDSLKSIGTMDIIKVQGRSTEFYYDLSTHLPFQPFGQNEYILQIDDSPLEINHQLFYNVETSFRKLVYSFSDEEVFKIDKEEILPEKIQLVEGFENHFCYSSINGAKTLCTLSTRETIQLKDTTIKVEKLLTKTNSKLINFQSQHQEHFVMDARFGFDNLKLAQIGEYTIKQTIDSPFSLGDNTFQNVLIETLGGTKQRVINLNNRELALFHLPLDLKADTERSQTSVFAGNDVEHIDLTKEIVIEQKVFYEATFISYLNDRQQIIIQKENGRPLQFDGLGHQNEIVQHFDPTTLDTAYRLGNHRIIGVSTLSEDLKQNQLLFSFHTMTSWIPFYDNYLPIFRRIKDFDNRTSWEYHLLEIHTFTNDKEYIAVEQNPPFRILADKTKAKFKPRIIKRKELLLTSPDDVSALRRFLTNAGHLVVVE